MEIIMTVIFCIVILCIFLICFISIYNSFQGYIIRINEVEADLDSTLRKRFDLLTKSIGIIEANTKEEKVLFEIENIRSKKLNNFELDRKIYEGINEFATIKENNPALKKNEEFMKIDLSLSESEAEIVASRKYYNDTITDYNKKVATFPNSFVAKICRFKIKPYFDGKDLNSKGNIKV